MGITRRNARNLAHEISSIETKILFLDPDNARENCARIRRQSEGSMRKHVDLLYSHLHSLEDDVKERRMRERPGLTP